MIAAAVLSSPMLTEPEVESFARMANVSEDVLRTIGSNRAWLKNYSVVLALAKNPKTPVALSMNLIQRLGDRDLNMLSVDRNVPESLRAAARRKCRGGDEQKISVSGLLSKTLAAPPFRRVPLFGRAQSDRIWRQSVHIHGRPLTLLVGSASTSTARAPWRDQPESSAASSGTCRRLISASFSSDESNRSFIDRAGFGGKRRPETP